MFVYFFAQLHFFGAKLQNGNIKCPVLGSQMTALKKNICQCWTLSPLVSILNCVNTSKAFPATFRYAFKAPHTISRSTPSLLVKVQIIINSSLRIYHIIFLFASFAFSSIYHLNYTLVIFQNRCWESNERYIKPINKGQGKIPHT